MDSGGHRGGEITLAGRPGAVGAETNEDAAVGHHGLLVGGLLLGGREMEIGEKVEHVIINRGGEGFAVFEADLIGGEMDSRKFVAAPHAFKRFQGIRAITWGIMVWNPAHEIFLPARRVSAMRVYPVEESHDRKWVAVFAHGAVLRMRRVKYVRAAFETARMSDIIGADFMFDEFCFKADVVSRQSADVYASG